MREGAETGGLFTVGNGVGRDAAEAEAETGFVAAAFLGDAALDTGLRGEAALFRVVGAAAFLGDARREGGALIGEEARASVFTLLPALRAREPGFFCTSVCGSSS